MKRRGRRVTRKSKAKQRKGSRKNRKTSRRQRGGAVDLPTGYDYTMAVSYKPKSDKIGSPDEVPRVGGRADFMNDIDRTA
jgi:hypothetical protein